MTRDYKIIFTSVGEIVSIPDSQDIFESLCEILVAMGCRELKAVEEKTDVLIISCVTPENTVVRPLTPLNFGNRKIKSEDYPMLKKLKKIKYISEDILSYVSNGDFYIKVIDNLSSGQWDVQSDILVTSHSRINFTLKECIKSVRKIENGLYVTKSERLLQTNNSKFQVLLKTNLSNIPEMLCPGTKIDLGLYSVFKIESIKEFDIVETKKGILISKYCPIDILNEIDIKNSYLRVGIRHGIKYIMEGSVIKPTRLFAGSFQENVNLRAKLNGRGYLFYI